ncbi:hypothetical protein [Loigolactobacillus jiayinensis]|uniref:Uncharacterized protein n=1 Tax=Loigolactobacillus jiayinensis TaxID=2486016 RepID=A0ABW1RGU7_9LACO|nr:hypothetical protein [Loigolactobacillus jiayinensis]
MQLTIPNQQFFMWLRAGQVLFFKDTLVLEPFAEDFQQILQLMEQDYQDLRAELGTATFTYSITPGADLAQAQIELRAVSADREKAITRDYQVFLDNVQ